MPAFHSPCIRFWYMKPSGLNWIIPRSGAVVGGGASFLFFALYSSFSRFAFVIAVAVALCVVSPNMLRLCTWGTKPP